MAHTAIYEVAAEIRSDWGSKIDPAADSYLIAMEQIRSIDDDYGQETAVEVVARFLSVANTWRGETARRIKVELNDMLDKQDAKDRLMGRGFEK